MPAANLLRLPGAARWIVHGAAAALIAACGSDEGADGLAPPAGPEAQSPPPATAPAPDPTAAALAEKPWEVISNKGETYLPNVFYADASQNEQIMPYAIDGHVMIDRLVYPTLGNPNLYTKGDAGDELTVVLRIEDGAFAQLSPKLEPIAGSPLRRLVIPDDKKKDLAFLLVSRSSREASTEAAKAISSGSGTGVYRVMPDDILVSPEPADMPPVLKQRKTVRFVFKQSAMAHVPAALYDLRFEVRKDDDLYRPKANAPPVFEYQYNAVRVFDAEPDQYSVINVTDTQVSIGSVFESRTREKLDELVYYLNTSSDPTVRNTAFVTFNGDLHNGGSPASLRQRTVAWTYEKEAKEIVALLKYLPVPIFLTAGNHDGYVSVGHVPRAVKTTDSAAGDSLAKVMTEAEPKAWPDFALPEFESYIAKTEKADLLGGLHRDIVTGGFARSSKGASFADGWREVPREDRNYILYDGFYQWQKTYGPLYFSWKFGKSFYLSLNSFELRQHRRSGWGMYTVNYGGGISDVQMAWLDRELLRAKEDANDVVVLAHHDPRGGHKAKDYGYYFEQVEYRSIYQSAIEYLIGKANSAVCKLPDWALPRAQEESCIHDGLQEWMRADEEFDCAWDERKPDLTCDKAKTKAFFASGIELMKRLASSQEVRTVLLGHTHYNSLEVLQDGDELLPGKLPVDGASAQKFATLEVENPFRGFAVQSSTTGVRDADGFDYDEHALELGGLRTSYEAFRQEYDKAIQGWPRTLSQNGGPRELVVLRLVSNADLANQTTQAGGKSALGFSVLHLTKKTDGRAFASPQINRATFFVNAGSSLFKSIATVDLDRTKKIKPHDAANPLEKLFEW